jgi:transcription antitermination factor NusG
MHWYVAYTLPNTEKSIFRSLNRMQIISFLPLQSVARKWKDRKKTIVSPLFPNYIFVYSTHNERYEALGIKGMIKYVAFNGKPAIIKDDQIEAIKKMLAGDIAVHTNTLANPGDRVRITDGPFSGIEGTIEKVNGRSRLCVRIECLGRTVSVNLSTDTVSGLDQNYTPNCIAS